uniref:Uncharacterized protein n=1 Tax=Rhizophora mucronata TaxID=61149 RepID=A0A2P2MD62_RHIMU
MMTVTETTMTTVMGTMTVMTTMMKREWTTKTTTRCRSCNPLVGRLFTPPVMTRTTKTTRK